jgi:hypothetical protein
MPESPAVNTHGLHFLSFLLPQGVSQHPALGSIPNVAGSCSVHIIHCKAWLAQGSAAARPIMHMLAADRRDHGVTVRFDPGSRSDHHYKVKVFDKSVLAH